MVEVPGLRDLEQRMSEALKKYDEQFGDFGNNLYFCTESGKNKYIDNICPRKVRERSERNPKGLTGEYLLGFIICIIA